MAGSNEGIAGIERRLEEHHEFLKKHEELIEAIRQYLGIEFEYSPAHIKAVKKGGGE